MKRALILFLTLAAVGLIPAAAQTGGQGGAAPKGTARRAVIRKKPEAVCTAEARSNGATGEVVLRAVLSSKGTVEQISVTRGLAFGLNESAIEAARKVEFEPAQKDGQPVSMWINLKYIFDCR